MPRSLRIGYANIAWDANPGGDNVTGYTIYYGTATGTYTDSVAVGNVTSYVLSAPGYKYFAITATNASGESDFSSEISL